MLCTYHREMCDMGPWRVGKVLKQHTWQLLKQNFKDLASLESHQEDPTHSPY